MRKKSCENFPSRMNFQDFKDFERFGLLPSSAKVQT